MRVCLDTNVLVAAVATRGLCADVVYLVLAEHELVIGETVLDELRRVLEKKLKVPRPTVAEFELLLRAEGMIVVAQGPAEIELRDPSDAIILAEATAGEADVLVTGDDDLLEVADQAPLPVRSPRQFWEELRSETD